MITVSNALTGERTLIESKSGLSGTLLATYIRFNSVNIRSFVVTSLSLSTIFQILKWPFFIAFSLFIAHPGSAQNRCVNVLDQAPVSARTNHFSAREVLQVELNDGRVLTLDSPVRMESGTMVSVQSTAVRDGVIAILFSIVRNQNLIPKNSKIVYFFEPARRSYIRQFGVHSDAVSIQFLNDENSTLIVQAERPLIVQDHNFSEDRDGIIPTIVTEVYTEVETSDLRRLDQVISHEMSNERAARFLAALAAGEAVSNFQVIWEQKGMFYAHKHDDIIHIYSAENNRPLRSQALLSTDLRSGESTLHPSLSDVDQLDPVLFRFHQHLLSLN